MNRALKFRLTAFALVIAALAVLIGWAAIASWREAAHLQTRLNTAHLRSFEIADHLQATILQLHTTLIRYEMRHDPKDRADFERESAALDHWINEQKPTLRSVSESELLNKVDAAYDLF